jgi:hypothetical protein
MPVRPTLAGGVVPGLGAVRQPVIGGSRSWRSPVRSLLARGPWRRNGRVGRVGTRWGGPLRRRAD